MRRREDLVFPIHEFERRLAGVRRQMADQGVDVLLVTTPENLTYLTAFETPGYFYWQGLLLPLEGEPVFVPRRLEASGVEALTWLDLIRAYEDTQDPMEKLRQTLEEFRWHDKRIGYEKECWFFTAGQQERLFAKCPNARFVDCSGMVEAGRLIKSEYEIEVMRKAARMAEVGMQAGIEAVRAGVREDDVAAEMYHAMIKVGCQWPGLAPFVASGPRGAIGHATWMGRTIREGDLVFLEVGGCFRRYHAAMMRGCYVGEPTPQLLKAEQLVIEAVEATLEAIRPGITAAEADAVNREIIAKADFGGTQATRSAYSIGIAVPPDWGEGHILSFLPGEDRVLEPNMTFHLIPWVQLPDQAGVGCSETIRVTENGCEVLTRFERRLFVK